MYIAGLQITRMVLNYIFSSTKFIWRRSPILTVPWWLSVYMDSYGTCQQSSFFEVHDEGYLVHAKGSGQAYQTMRCSLRFRAARDQQLCVKFNSFVIDDCSVNFKVFQESQPIDFARQPKDECLFVSTKWDRSTNAEKKRRKKDVQWGMHVFKKKVESKNCENW